MKTVLLGISAIVVFAAATAGSLFLQSKQQQPEATASTSANETNSSGADSVLDGGAGGESSAGELAARTNPVSVEEMVRLGMDLKKREQKLIADEEQLKQQKIQHAIALKDLQAERGAVDEMRQQVESELSKAEGLVQRLLSARQAVIDEQNKAAEQLKEIEEAQIEVDDQQSENTKKLAQWIQSMDDEKAAEVLTEMTNDGKLPLAVQILSHLEERDVAGILSEIDDAKLVQDFVNAFHNLKTTKTGSRLAR